MSTVLVCAVCRSNEYVMESGNDARRGGFGDLVCISYPKVRLSEVSVAPTALAQLERVLDEQRRRELLAVHGFAPLRRLLFTGPMGTGKSMTASALATELSLPLVTIRIDGLLSKYTGETAAKLRVVFDAMTHSRAVCLFDDIDASTGWRVAGDDIVEARRVLAMFLSFLAETQSESLVVAVADHRSLLDNALLRRFDAVIPYALPNPAQALDLLRQRLDCVDTAGVRWEEIPGHARGLSQAGLVRAAETAAKHAILNAEGLVSTATLINALGESGGPRHPTGFGRSRLPEPTAGWG